MTSDADRFRPRVQRPVAAQTSPAQQRAAYPRSSGSVAHASAPRASVPYGSVPYGSPPHAAPSAGFPPQQGSFNGHDAPLIHPAAAQASSAVAYGVPVYRAPAYGTPPQQARGLSITALVLGICSFFFAWTLIVVPIIGIVFGSIALRREPAGRTMATLGLITSSLGLLWVLLFYVLPFGAFFAAMVIGGFLV